ncbi:MAG: elongation factor 4 [Candidatus Aminicenantes bacterium]|nr:elongation factor 4 [Candidatus Aminicenantes bacterium]
MDNIRNFSIIAHIDHGKSTLADRLIQAVGLVSPREFRDQILDTMDLERERGITIKSQTVTLPYRDKIGNEYELNLIDTPGHVDFSYEVSRALASCEGVLLVVDASQGVEAQTVANLYMAMEHDLVIVPVINKIDLISADIEMTKEQIENELGLDSETAILCSAKEGKGIERVFEAIVKFVPPPTGSPDAPLKAHIFDAQYDPFRGTIVACRVFEGCVGHGDLIRLMSNGATYKVEEVGLFKIHRKPKSSLSAGEVGYITAGIKKLGDTRIGDTITLDSNPTANPIGGFKAAKPVVFSSIYPMASDEYQSLRESLEKYELNDASLTYQKDSSAALGQGFRCGFLGLLHLEIFQQRLEREYGASIVMTVPSVEYRFILKNSETLTIDNPQYYPDPAQIQATAEPYIKATLLFPEKYMGVVMKLCLSRRGSNPRSSYPTPGRIELRIEMPLAEAIYDFYDTLKTITQGYGSLDYELSDYRESDLVRLDILVNGERVDALSLIVHRDKAREWGVRICDRLKDEIPRHQFKIAIQGAIGGNIISRSTISPYRKDVTAKLYGGDVTRKQKLLKKQKKGKKRMKMVGSVMIPQSAFAAVLKTEDK